jgi:phenylacetic acid degradation operon negative regulatory protein
VHARSALFDLYGDHLRARTGRAPVAGLVRLLAPLGVSAAAVRTAISRMVRQGWLVPVRLESGPGYALTDQARLRLDDAAARIYRTRRQQWDGSWDLLVLERVGPRPARDRVRSGLGFLGYAPLTDDTWIGPTASPEAAALLDAESARFTRFSAHDAEPGALAARVWDLAALGTAYQDWLRFAQDLVHRPERHVGPLDGGDPDERAFAVRSLLVHEWRKFLFADPGLPVELLPGDWPGTAAARFFDQEAARLLPAARRYVDACLSADNEPDVERAR